MCHVVSVAVSTSLIMTRFECERGTERMGLADASGLLTIKVRRRNHTINQPKGRLQPTNAQHANKQTTAISELL